MMNFNLTDSFASLSDALKFVSFTSGLFINETFILPSTSSKWSSIISVIPLVLGFIGLIFSLMVLFVFPTSKTFRQSSFHCYIYAFVTVNSASIVSHSWSYLIFYIVDPTQICTYLNYFQQSLSTTSLWFMVFLSIERSLAFAWPYVVKKYLQSHRIYAILSLAMFISFLLHVDEILYIEIKAFRWVNFAYGLCSIKRNFRIFTDRMKIFRHASFFILPFLINSLLDLYICTKICQRRQSLFKRSMTITHKKRSRRSKISLANEITLTLLCQSLWLLLTYFPARFYYLLISFKLIDDHDRDDSPLTYFIRFNLLIYLAFSPTLYVILSPTLRREIQSYFTHRSKRSRTTSSTFLSSINRKLEKLFGEIRTRPNAVIFISHSEEFPPRSHPICTSIPQKKHPMTYLSKSSPCLSVFNSDAEFWIKLERSSTIHE